MPTILNSPLGSRKISDSQLKEFQVPDESGASIGGMSQEQDDIRASLEYEKEYRMAKEIRRTGRERLNEGARRRIEMLIGMTRTTHAVKIGENEYVFQSLQAKEMRAALIAAAEFDGTIQSPFEIRKQLLARSLTHIAGIEIEQFLGTDQFNDRLLFIEELDEALLNRLYAEYLKMAEEARDKFALKSDEDAKEVIDNLKK
jgi:hypothetical protein